MNPDRKLKWAFVPRSANAVFAAVREVIEGDQYQVLDLRRSEREVTFTCLTDTSAVEHTYEVGLGELEDGTALAVQFWTPPAAAPSRKERRQGRQTARRVLEEVRAAVDGVEMTAAERKMIEKPLGTSVKRFLANLTGRRAWLAALVLLGAYLLPALLVWGIAQASETPLFGDNNWIAPTLALSLGLGLVVGLTIRFGGWFQAVSFGEEYMLSFHPVAGYFLGWWRFVVQLGGGFLVIMLAVDVGEQATTEEVSNAETAALPTYAERAPIPDGWELSSDRLSQSVYEERPNASFNRTYIVPAAYGLKDMETWLRSRAWADGIDGRPPFGALRDIECEARFGTCEAQVTPPVDEPIEYFVDVRLDETNVDQDGEPVPAGLLSLDVEYEEHGSRPR